MHAQLAMQLLHSKSAISCADGWQGALAVARVVEIEAAAGVPLGALVAVGGDAFCVFKHARHV